MTSHYLFTFNPELDQPVGAERIDTASELVARACSGAVETWPMEEAPKNWGDGGTHLLWVRFKGAEAPFKGLICVAAITDVMAAPPGSKRDHLVRLNWLPQLSELASREPIAPSQRFSVGAVSATSTRAAIEEFLRAHGDAAPPEGFLPDLRHRRDTTAVPAVPSAAIIDVDRWVDAHSGHRETLHLLLDWLEAQNLPPLSRVDAPEFDAGWIDGGTPWVAEVKSLLGIEAHRLRLGLGQVLDYRSQMRPAHAGIRAALVVQQRPTDDRWLAVCAEVDVVLCWPGEFERLHA